MTQTAICMSITEVIQISVMAKNVEEPNFVRVPAALVMIQNQMRHMAFVMMRQ